MTGDVIDDQLAALRSVLSVRLHPDGKNVRRASYDGGICGICARDLQPDEPVWRRRLPVGRGWAGDCWGIAGICAQCHEARDGSGSSWRRQYFKPRPCEGCHRPVYIEADCRDRRYCYCSDRCKIRRQSTAARAKRTDARGTKQCPCCGEIFEPTRTDSKFCSGPCRQKAYRQRVTAINCGDDANIKSRNVTDDKRDKRDGFISRNAAEAVAP